MENLYNFKAGDRIIFKKDWNPGTAREDPFYIIPVPKGTIGTILDVAPKYLRVRLDDKDNWPNPILLWANIYDDDVQSGMDCIGKLIVN